MSFSGQLALDAAAQRISTVYGGKSAGNAINAEQDVSYRQLHFQATGADAFIGATSAVDSSNYGVKVDSTDLQPIVLDGTPGGIKLSDYWAAGAGATLHILGIPL